ncbi:FAM49 family protein [Heterostelium album PN500]|uniref:FAM49 family protein n=1 Tax=Heterostelium pallidum (strain ATCC 26659 / Pp 5 / PN500) TaxID=670386 RepID=D3BP97_HETP5|nr:FAM49 family protein [Heterostelium album PN500]EFA77107.1 FAM49 family protein [Heterostelium album PN500]|eukprot:XP_020429236.1 FAM49 family protein [Heterostelium album PN500]
MGQLLSFINGTDHAEQIFIDFENAQPSEEERELHNTVGEVLNIGPEILQKLTTYTGCNEYIRRAITNPGPDTEETAWEHVLPAVDILQEFYDFSLKLEDCFPKLLIALCKNDPKASLSNQQAIAKQLADVFDFVLRFDDAKMVNPAIQNDFSYYRRTLNRMKLTKKDANIKIRDELANRMSLFFAYPTPMMKVLSETTVKFLSTPEVTVPRDNVTTTLSTMANVCHDMVDKKKFNNVEINMFCLRAMVGSVILFDHIHPQGAFVKKSPINDTTSATSDDEDLMVQGCQNKSNKLKKSN